MNSPAVPEQVNLLHRNLATKAEIAVVQHGVG